MICTEATLAELYTAYDKLIIGTKVVKVTIDGESTEFSLGSIKALKNRIDDCETTLNGSADPWTDEGVYIVTSSKGYGA